MTTFIFVFVIIAAIFGLPFAQQVTNDKSPMTNSGYIDIGISESSDIRKIVWEGAVKVWERYPVLGSGVETFGLSYYKDRPVAHNMVSEWDFLYNKAHNEYLNLLATTGTVGFLAYLFVILAASRIYKNGVLQIGLFAGWVTILVTNFFGFSVVIIGLYFFLIPAFIEILNYEK